MRDGETGTGQSVFLLERGFPPDPSFSGIYASLEVAMSAAPFPPEAWERGGEAPDDRDWWQAGRGPSLSVISRFEVQG